MPGTAPPTDYVHRPVTNAELRHLFKTYIRDRCERGDGDITLSVHEWDFIRLILALMVERGVQP